MPIKPYRGDGVVYPLGVARFIWWALSGYHPGDHVEPTYEAMASEVERLIPRHLAGAGLGVAVVRLVDGSVAGSPGVYVRASDAALAELELQQRVGFERKRDAPYANTDCPACGHHYPVPPKGTRPCPGCNTRIHVLTGADARRYLVADADVEAFHAEQHRLGIEAEQAADPVVLAVATSTDLAGVERIDTSGVRPAAPLPDCRACGSPYWQFFDAEGCINFVFATGYLGLAVMSRPDRESVACAVCEQEPPARDAAVVVRIMRSFPGPASPAEAALAMGDAELREKQAGIE